MELVEDVWTVIASYLEPRDLAALALSEKALYRLSMPIRSVTRSAGNLTLRPTQALTRDAILRHTEGYYTLRAPMSYGKTVVALSVMLADPDHLYVAIVPPMTLSHWMDQIEKMFGRGVAYLPGDPANSQVLVVHSARKIHYQYAQLGSVGAKTRFVLTSSGVKIKLKYGGRDVRYIVDEAQSLQNWLTIVGPAWCLLLSANMELLSNTNISSIESNVMQSIIPVAHHTFCQIESQDERNKLTPMEGRTSAILDRILDYQQVISDILTTTTCTKCVVFTPGTKDVDFLHSSIRKSWEVFVLHKSTRPIFRFEKYVGRSLLLATHAASVGVNINSEMAIIIRPDWMNVNRISQIIGRTLRITNQIPVVEIYHLMPFGVPTYRARLAAALHELGERLDISDNAPLYNAGAVLVRALGYNWDTLSSIDTVVINLHDYNKPEFTLQLWEKHKVDSVLSEQMVRLLLHLDD
jgi:hypothetical protein